MSFWITPSKKLVIGFCYVQLIWADTGGYFVLTRHGYLIKKYTGNNPGFLERTK